MNLIFNFVVLLIFLPPPPFYFNVRSMKNSVDVYQRFGNEMTAEIPLKRKIAEFLCCTVLKAKLIVSKSKKTVLLCCSLAIRLSSKTTFLDVNGKIYPESE